MEIPLGLACTCTQNYTANFAHVIAAIIAFPISQERTPSARHLRTYGSLSSTVIASAAEILNAPHPARNLRPTGTHSGTWGDNHQRAQVCFVYLRLFAPLSETKPTRRCDWPRGWTHAKSECGVLSVFFRIRVCDSQTNRALCFGRRSSCLR